MPSSVHYPWLARLPAARYLAAARSAFVCHCPPNPGALLATFHGPRHIGASRAVPMCGCPIESPGGIDGVAHSDLVSNGWSRVCFTAACSSFTWERVNETTPRDWLPDSTGWVCLNLHPEGSRSAEAVSSLRYSGIPFWPFGALTNAVRADTFQPFSFWLRWSWCYTASSCGGWQQVVCAKTAID